MTTTDTWPTHSPQAVSQWRLQTTDPQSQTVSQWRLQTPDPHSHRQCHSQWRLQTPGPTHSHRQCHSDDYRRLIHTQLDSAFLAKALQASIAVLTSISRCTVNHTDALTDVAMSRTTDSYHNGQQRCSFFLRLRSILVALGSTPSTPQNTWLCVFLTSVLTFPLHLVLGNWNRSCILRLSPIPGNGRGEGPSFHSLTQGQLAPFLMKPLSLQCSTYLPYKTLAILFTSFSTAIDHMKLL